MSTAGILELRFCSQWAFKMHHALRHAFSFALAGLSCLRILCMQILFVVSTSNISIPRSSQPSIPVM